MGPDTCAVIERCAVWNGGAGGAKKNITENVRAHSNKANTKHKTNKTTKQQNNKNKNKNKNKTNAAAVLQDS